MVPKIDKAWIEELAEKYDYNKDEIDSEERIFAAIRTIGQPPPYLTKEIFMMIVNWKASRAKGYAAKNEAQFIVDVTRVAFSARNEGVRIGVLTLMKGVRYRMASAILYFCFPTKYPIMDWRAWNSLRAIGKMRGRMEDTFECWQEYTRVCREIAKQNRVTLRTLDKALWVYKGGAQ